MTEQKKATLNMTLIPLVVLIIMVIGAGYFLIQGEIKFPSFNKGPQIRRLEGFPTIVYTTKMIEKQRNVIKTEEELNNFLNSVDESGLLALKENINFNKEFLLAVTTETEPEAGHRIKVKKVYEDKEKKVLLVSLLEEEYAEECENDKDSNVAVDIVAITKTDYSIEFDRIKKVLNCE